VTGEGRGDYDLVLTPPARPALTGRLPEAVAAAVIEFLTTALIQQPYRVGKPLRDDLEGLWSARRGTYRVLYRVREDLREVIVLRVEHRRDAYRPL
jgi:mRNA-degrading endonuclease RelE of RelBE toxin-antitoxin system